ncbi:MAG: VCBS repeat-containing protein, partial [candidate division WOR-3 bacterium]
TLEVVVHVADLGSIRKPGNGCYVLRHNGDSLWKFLFYTDTLDRHGAYTSPAVTDLDNDGRLEIICHTGWFQREYPYPLIERRIFILNSDGTLRRSWRTEGPGAGYTPDYASPVAADINFDGIAEIVVARRPGWLDCYDTAGTMLPGFPVNLTLDANYYPSNPVTRAFSTPAVGDINNDGQLEIVIGTSGRQTDNSRWSGRIHAFRSDGTRVPGFPYTTRNGVWYSPAIANLDFGCDLEIATSACDSAFYVVTKNGDSLAGWPLRHFPTYWLPDNGSYAFIEGIIPMSRTPFVADIDADNLNEIIMTGRDGQLYVWNCGGPTDSTTLPCPTFRFNKQRTGWYRHLPVAITADRSRNPRKGLRVPAMIRQGTVLEITAEDITALPLVVDVLDCTGRKVNSVRADQTSQGFTRLCLSTGNLSAGVYFLSIPNTPSRCRVTITR